MSSPPKANRQQPPLEDQIFIAVMKAADYLGQQAEQLLKSHGLTGTQYNVLRILRGAGQDGLPCRSVGDRMISHDPDMTRLLDRMEKRGLITRERQKDDRRVVKTRITAQGMEMLKRLDQPVREMHKQQFQHMNATKLKQLADLLGECQKPASKGPSEAS
ncbi:MAG TPA: MarR family transcriptional regulator [Candidatus Dormibacteraeota bacterium]|jgi:DNA-binding MarR family transcriptional regulator|nr:MarR family transcriptional regulator [Candidatus Dormibacteraeota bacterium]